MSRPDEPEQALGDRHPGQRRERLLVRQKPRPPEPVVADGAYFAARPAAGRRFSDYTRQARPARTSQSRHSATGIPVSAVSASLYSISCGRWRAATAAGSPAESVL